MNWLRTAFDRVVGFVPNLIAGLVILAVGYLVARVLARVARPLLHRAGFDRLLARHNLIETRGEGEERGSSGVGTAIFWVVMLVAAMQAARAWTLNYIADGLARFIGYLPNVVAAAFIFGVALFFGDWVRRRMITREAASSSAPTIAPGAVRSGILVLGAFMALRQLLIAPQIVTVAFALALGAIAVAAALSFGLGGRNVAERMTRGWYDQRRRSSLDEEDVDRPILGPDDRPRAPTH
jgi:hypothetical protein